MAANKGKGRSRGVMWPTHMPLACTAGFIYRMQGVPSVMFSVDGSSFGPDTSDGFLMPNLFGMGPRAVVHMVQGFLVIIWGLSLA